MKRIVSLAVALSCLASVGCRREGDVTGDVFIVTRAGVNVRLGLVAVSVIAEADAVAAVERFRTTATREVADQIKVALAAGKTAGDEDTAYKEQKARVDALWDRFIKDPLARDAGALHAKADADGLRVDALAKNASDAFARFSEEVEKADRLRDGARLFSFLPKSPNTTKTDADGRFALRIPRRGRVAIAARGPRDVGAEKETYYWLIWASLEGRPDKRILLSNDNQVTVASPETLIDLTKIGGTGAPALRAPAPSQK